MVLQKNFKITPNEGLVCENMDDVSSYIGEKIELFRDYGNYTSKQKKIELLEEILKMYNEDVLNPQIDMSAMTNVVYSDKADTRLMIQYYDMVWILGTIIFNVFDYGENAVNHFEDGINGPINMSEMLWQAYSQLHAVKMNGENAAYGATLIFTTVLESELKRKFKDRFIQDKLSEVDNIVRQGGYSLTEEEKELMKFLRHDEHAKTYNSVYATTYAAYDLFVSVGVVDASNNDQKNLLLNKTTLNQLLGYSFFVSKVEPAFLETMRLLFQTGNLNLRNDIAHGGFGYKNYYHTSATSLLFFMATLVITDEYLL